ncbi:MAG: hypothetical protein IKL06_07885 [Lachnospiraceae bacterium]|nr:hypothetical protein [Lachnospiraceae bacterium]
MEQTKTKIDLTSSKVRNILIVLSIFATVKMLFFAFGLDEEYQLVMSYRNAMGDKLFYSMWEPHQSSAFLCSILMKPYLALFGTQYIVLYLRACGALIHFLISVYFYKTIKNYTKSEYAWILALIYYNTIPKQIMMPEFGMMQVWFFTLLFLFLLRYYVGSEEPTFRRKRIHIILAAVMLVGNILSYPSCLILYPFMLYVFWRFSGEYKWKDMALFTLVCVLCGIAYLSYLLSNNTIEGLLNTISLIVNGDITHSIEASQKLTSLLVNSVYLLGLCLLCYGLAYLISFLRAKKGKSTNKCHVMILMALLIQMIYWVILNSGYETMQLHITVIAGLGVYAYFKMKNEDKEATLRALLLTGILGSLISLVAVLYLTDLTLIESLPHAMLATFFGMLLFIMYEQKQLTLSGKCTLSIVLLCWALVAIFGKGYTLRSGTGYNNVLQSGGILKEGPAGLTISNYMGAYVYNCDYEAWQQYIQDGDNVLIMVDQVMNLGTIQYLFKDVELSHYSIVNPTPYDERLLNYWEMFPEKEPNVIIVDCWYGQLMTDENGWLMKYIENDFGYTQVNEDKYIRIYRR